MSTKIGWTNETWNTIVGCSKVSEGCKNCYAEKMAVRLDNIGLQQYAKVVKEHVGWNGKTAFVKSAPEKPLHWKKPRMIFVNSMGDTFHESVPFDWIDGLMRIIRQCPQHTFQILTKRPKRMHEYFCTVNELPECNVWLGVTAENQRCADERIPILLQIPAAKRFVSIEPMLGNMIIDPFIHPIDNNGKQYKSGLDWIIVGCESGHNRRECKIEWVESVVQQCQDANVPVFVKQLSINGKVEHDITKFPKHLQIQEWPK